MIRPRIRRFFRLRPRARADVVRHVDEEIRLHIELRAEQLMRGGMPAHEALAEAERRFGRPSARWDLHRTATQREGVLNLRDWLDSWLQDLRYAIRALVHEPLLAGMVILTLGLGIGANASMFGIIDRLLLRGPAYVIDPNRVQRLYLTRVLPGMGEFTGNSVGYITYSTMRTLRSLEGVGAYSHGEATLGRGENAEKVSLAYASWDLFPVLGVQPALGRFFTRQEDTPYNAASVAVLDYDFWKSHFAGRIDVLGRPLRFEEGTYTIIGVAPRGFTGAQLESFSVWLPLARRPPVTTDWATTWQAQWLRVFGRLRDDVTAEQAGAEATAAFRSAYTGTQDDMKTATVSFRPLHFGPLGKERSETAVARWLLGVSLVVLLIACANVANLLLARAFRRRREIAVRLALGVGRGRLARLLLTESVLLALCGGLAALGIAYWGGHFVRLVLLPDVQWAEPPLNSRVLLFSALATLGTGLIIGLIPAVHGVRQDLVHSLKTGVREGGGARSRVRGALTIVQAALSVLLLVGGGLFVRSLQAIHGLDLGIEPKRVLTVDIDRERQTFDPHPAKMDARLAADRMYYRGALERVQRVTGVSRAALSIGTPFYTEFGVHLEVPGFDKIPDMPGGGPYIAAVTPDYFATVGTRLLRGRGFTAADREGSQRVTIVNQTMAEVLWPSGNALGKCMIIGDEAAPCSTVVGIVEEARRNSLKEERAFQYYVPLGQEIGMGGSMLLARPTSMDDAGIAARIGAALRELDPGVRFIETKTLQEALDPQIRPWRLGATMFTIFGGLALLIAAVGLYSVIAYAVAQRRAELGIRMALGARAVDVVRLVLTQAVMLAGAGLLVGALIALVGAPFLQPMLFDVSARDPVTYTVVAVTLFAVAVLAGTVPAARARRVSPSEALRSD